ncbi:hypothetical protein AAVH_29194 [Aphelenchoides avenae]|nr:hypothetical protein AAVH_29194 [Aphelenchus avenae]
MACASSTRVCRSSSSTRREFVPMECVQVVEDKKLLFVSVLAARQATSPAIAAVYRVDFDEV